MYRETGLFSQVKLFGQLIGEFIHPRRSRLESLTHISAFLASERVGNEFPEWFQRWLKIYLET